MGGFKVAILVPDGAADLPVRELGGATPLEAARTPNMDEVARRGAVGLAVTVPPGMPPGSDVANLSLLGYDPRSHFGGRGPIEAANLGVEVPPGWTAFRCNLVSTDGRRMLDYSSGHIRGGDAGEAVRALNEKLGDEGTRFYRGKSYRNILLLEGDYREVECTPPHDITGMPLDGHMPSGRGAEKLIRLMEESRDVLRDLPANRRLAAEGRPTADMIWPWGQGERMELEPFAERFGLEGAVISAVDLVCGLGRLAGLRTVEVPGITGFLDTNYRGKGEAAVRVLEEDDFVYVHVEAPDEASHMGDAAQKVRAIERFDEDVVGPVLEAMDGARRLLVCPDHPTYLSTRTHDGSPVPYATCGEGISPSGRPFNEKEARSGGLRFERGWELMFHVTGTWVWPSA